MASIKQIYGDIQFDLELPEGTLPLYVSIEPDGVVVEMGIVASLDDEADMLGYSEAELQAFGEQFVEAIRAIHHNDLSVLAPRPAAGYKESEGKE